MRSTPLIGVTFACALVAPALAQNSWTWKASQTGPQAWSSGSNWQYDGGGNGNSVPQNTGDAANLQVDIAGATDVTNPSGQIGTLRIGDTNGSHSFTISGSGITFATNGGLPLLQKTGTATDIISAPVNMNGGLQADIATGSRLDLTGNIQNGSSLTKTGGGVLRLSGDYGNANGTFTVSGGTLVIDSVTVQNSNLSTVQIQSGATLAGSGRVVGATTFATGAVHTPGNSPAGSASGIQTFTKSLNYQSGSIFSWSLTAAATTGRGSAYDGVNANAGLTVAAGTIFRVVSDLDFSGTWWDSQRVWTDLFAVNGAAQGWAAGTLAAVFDSAGGQRDLSGQGQFSLNGTQLTWTPVSPVPEPASLMAGLLIFAGLSRRSRKTQLVR